MIRYLNFLSKAANIISLACLLCQLFGVKQSHPNVKCNIKKNIKISFLFPKQGNRNAKRTEKHKNKITQGKT